MSIRVEETKKQDGVTGTCEPRDPTYGRGPVVNGVLRTPDGATALRLQAMLRSRKAGKGPSCVLMSG